MLITWGYITNKEHTQRKLFTGIFQRLLWSQFERLRVQPLTKADPYGILMNKQGGSGGWRLVNGPVIFPFTWTCTCKLVIYIQKLSLQKFLEHVLCLKKICIFPPNFITSLFWVNYFFIHHAYYSFHTTHTPTSTLYFFSGLFSTACWSHFIVLFAFFSVISQSRKVYYF